MICLQVVKRSGDGNGGAGGGAGRRDCIRLRGLPYEARVEHVVRLYFFIFIWA